MQVQSDYRAFLEKAGEAAASWQVYWARACQDLYNEMTVRDSEDAFNCAGLLAHNVQFAPKRVSLDLSLHGTTINKINNLAKPLGATN